MKRLMMVAGALLLLCACPSSKPHSLPTPSHTPTPSASTVLTGADCLAHPGRTLAGVDLSKHSLIKADFRCADLRGANLASADLRFANLFGANLTNADLTGTDLRGVDLSYATLPSLASRPRNFEIYASTWCPKLVGAHLRRARLFAGLQFPGGCQWAGVDLAGADLTKTTWAGGVNQTPGVDLSGADLHGAILTKATLWKANLSNANLAGANLTNADLKNANLTGADLRGAVITDARWTSTTCPDGTLSSNDLGTCANNLG